MSEIILKPDAFMVWAEGKADQLATVLPYGVAESDDEWGETLRWHVRDQGKTLELKRYYATTVDIDVNAGDLICNINGRLVVIPAASFAILPPEVKHD